MPKHQWFNGPSAAISLAEFVALCSTQFDRPVMESLAIVGEIKLSGTMGEVNELSHIFRVCKNAGAKKILIPFSTLKDLQSISTEFLSSITPVFYSDPIDAAKKH